MGLTFSKLRQTNIQRCEQDFNHPLNSWSNSDWGLATCGEAGEAANVAKKMNRFRDGLKKFDDEKVEILRGKLASEMADTLIYLDRWAASQGIDLEQALIDTFNKKSDEKGVPTKL